MGEWVKVDDTNLQKYIRKIQRKGPKLVKKATTRYVNNMVAEVKKESAKTLEKAFQFKNASTRKYANRFVHYKKSSVKNSPISEVGALGDIEGKSFQTRKGGFLAAQELGKDIKQIKSGGSGHRRNLFVRVPRNTKPKTSPRIKRSVIAKRTGNDRVNMAVAFKIARKKRIPYVTNKWGVYRVLQRSAKKIYSTNNKERIRVNKRQWLQPAVDNVLARREPIMKETIDYLIKEIGAN